MSEPVDEELLAARIQRTVAYLESHLDWIDPKWSDQLRAQIHEDVLRDVLAMLSPEYDDFDVKNFWFLPGSLLVIQLATADPDKVDACAIRLEANVTRPVIVIGADDRLGDLEPEMVLEAIGWSEKMIEAAVAAARDAEGR